MMRTRLLALIDECNDPFAREIRYHPACWRTYVGESYKKPSSYELPLQNMREQEVRQLFFAHVKEAILVDNEPRTMKGLLSDYNHLLSNYNFPNCDRTSYLKKILEDEFGSRIGFHERYHRNKSTIVYDTSKGGSYIEAAIHSWGISDDQLLQNTSRRLRDSLKSFPTVNWPPNENELEKHPTAPSQLENFLVWL